MSLQLAAQHLASKGRGPDTTLVHMTPGEVHGLQALARAHGGTLTTNPDTGLPEAGFLSKLLPTIAGIGLTIASGGALTPLMAAGLVGGGTALATGNLRKGLMAGLGAYGGAGIAGSVAGLSTAAAAPAAAGAAPDFLAAGIDVPVSGMGAAAPDFLAAGVDVPAAAGFMPSAPVIPPTSTISSLPSATGGADLYADQALAELPGGVYGGHPISSSYAPMRATPLSAIGDIPNPPMPATPAPGAVSVDPFGKFPTAGAPTAAPYQFGGAAPGELGSGSYGLPSFEDMYGVSGQPSVVTPTVSAPTPALTAAPMETAGRTVAMPDAVAMTKPTWANIKSGLANAMEDPSKLFNMQNARYGLAALSSMGGGSGSGSGIPGSGPNPYEYTYDYRTGQYSRVPVGTRDKMQMSPGVPMQRAAGGPVEAMSERNQYETMMANGGQMYAAGGISHLGDYSDGGRLLRGPGDGVSDSIPATIADKRPARLADGEFVVPARVVSELGNGSTEAGARKLYAMMDRIQQNRSKSMGKGKVAVNSRSEKLLPA